MFPAPINSAKAIQPREIMSRVDNVFIVIMDAGVHGFTRAGSVIFLSEQGIKKRRYGQNTASQDHQRANTTQTFERASTVD